jgi:hypothetical protein
MSHAPASPHRPARRRAALLPTLLAVAAACAATSARADERADLEQLRATTTALIQALVDQGLISAERAQALLRQAQPRPAEPSTSTATAAAAPGAAASSAWGTPLPHTVRVPYLSETQRAQIEESLRNDVMSTAREEGWADSRQLPPWLKLLTFEGDIRVRGEGDLFASGNAPAALYQTQTASPSWAPDLTNTQHSLGRGTLRARFGVKATVSDNITAGLRLSTGNSPTSGSQTLAAGSGFSNRYTFGLDRAWIDYEPRQDYHVTAGRMETPFAGTDLLWPEDLSLDGVALRGRQNIAGGASAFATLGAFALQEFPLDGGGKWLFGAQVGSDWAIGSNTDFRVAAAFYDFYRVEGVAEANPPPSGPLAATTPYQQSQYPAGARLKGNTLINLNDPTNAGAPVWGLASKFRPVNVMASLTLHQFDPVDVGFTFDYVHNSAFDVNDIARRAGVAMDNLAERTTGIQAQFQVGSRRQGERGAWKAYAGYRDFQRDAWLDAFTDTTWNLGGTNYRGFTIGTAYTFEPRTSVGLRWTSTRNLDDHVRTLADPNQPTTVIGDLSSAPLKIDVIQLDLNTRF